MDPEQSQKHVQPHAQINQEIIANGVQPGQLQLFDFRRIVRYPQPLSRPLPVNAQIGDGAVQLGQVVERQRACSDLAALHRPPLRFAVVIEQGR